MVRDGVNGLVFKTDNFIELSYKIEYVKKNESEYKRMSENAYLRYCNELNAKNMARKTEELYTSLFLAVNDEAQKSEFIQDNSN